MDVRFIMESNLSPSTQPSPHGNATREDGRIFDGFLEGLQKEGCQGRVPVFYIGNHV